MLSRIKLSSKSAVGTEMTPGVTMAQESSDLNFGRRLTSQATMAKIDQQLQAYEEAQAQKEEVRLPG